MLTAALLSLLVTDYPRQSLRELRWLVLEPLLLFYVARATLKETYHVRLALWSVVASGAIAALVALFSLVMQGTLFSAADRAANPYLSPNHLGLFLGRAGAVGLALALFAPLRALPTSVVSLPVILAALLRTLSLGGWAGFGAAAVAVTALHGRRWLAATVVSLLIVFLIGVVALPAGRTTGRLDPNTGTALFRLQIWSSSLRMLADHPLLGIGLDNFLYQYRAGYMLPEAGDEPNISHPHNWVLNFWLELGLLGLMSALGLLVWVARTAWRLVREPIEFDDRLVGAAAIGVFVDTLVHGSLDNSYFLVDAAVVWWLFVALLIVVDQRRAVPPNR
jgi:O-antigen ligase